ncbi:MAG: hypothetical protein JXA07_12215 [Spirochaetes bacterium]|nr:hypothetical protein [Spirochaetota bacterium]
MKTDSGGIIAGNAVKINTNTGPAMDLYFFPDHFHNMGHKQNNHNGNRSPHENEKNSLENKRQKFDYQRKNIIEKKI